MSIELLSRTEPPTVESPVQALERDRRLREPQVLFRHTHTTFIVDCHHQNVRDAGLTFRFSTEAESVSGYTTPDCNVLALELGSAGEGRSWFYSSLHA